MNLRYLVAIATSVAFSGCAGGEDEVIGNQGLALASSPAQAEIEIRRERIREHFRSRLERLDIVHTSVTPSGQVLDWTPRRHPRVTPPPPPEGHTSPQTGPDGGELRQVRNELMDHPELQGPEGTVPRLRFDVEAYLDLVGDNVPASVGEMFGSPSPNAQGKYYVTRAKSVTNYGMITALNIWNVNGPYGNGNDGENSIAQISLTRGSPMQTIEVGKIEDRALNPGSYAPHFFIYYTTINYDDVGDNVGGWNETVDGWEQVHATWYPGAQLGPVSTWQGTQYESVVAVQLRSDNNWWVWWAGVWVGYYPASLFATTGLRSQASAAHAYGEVTDRLAPAATSTDMGGPGMGNEGWAKAAFIRNFGYYTALNGATLVNLNSSTMPAAGVTDAACYSDGGAQFGSPPDWVNYWYYGGGGNEETGCN